MPFSSRCHVLQSQHRGSVVPPSIAGSNPFGWWRDTLQPLRMSVIGAALYFIGSCFALPHTDRRGIMIFWFYAALALGLFIGERIVYAVYLERIA
jgi:hypothetical protein